MEAIIDTQQRPSGAREAQALGLLKQVDGQAEGVEVDLHRLELRFAPLRVVEPRALDALVRSLQASGQCVACTVVADTRTPALGAASARALVLIDGYRRVQALQRLGRDTVRVACLPCDVAQALILTLARHTGRAYAAVEEALVLRELVEGHGLSEREVARRCGRDASWVSRRLGLVCGLSDEVLQALREGTISTWAASRVMVPLARANSKHASVLVGALSKVSLSTRELKTWFEHYGQSGSLARARMVEAPKLFIQSVMAQNDKQQAKRLAQGPQARLVSDLGQCTALVRRLCGQLQQIDSHSDPDGDVTLSLSTEQLLSAIEQLLTVIEPLRRPLHVARNAPASPERPHDIDTDR